MERRGRRDRRPDASARRRARGDASIRYGNFDTQVYQASVGGPLWRDKAFVSLAGIENRRDGYVRNVFRHEPLDDRDLLAGRVRLVAKPFPRLEVALTGEGEHARDGPTALVPIDGPDPFRVAVDTPGRQQSDGSLGALRLRWAGPGVEVRSITARRWFDSPDNETDLDASPRPLLVAEDDHRFRIWSEEVHVASTGAAARFRWHVGGFFEDTATRRLTAFRVTSPPIRDTQVGDFGSRTLAAFGRTTVVMLPGVELTAGLRYENFRPRWTAGASSSSARSR